MEEQAPRVVPPGWYPDPKMAGTQRYWDGEAWTDGIAPLAPAPFAPQRPGMRAPTAIAIVAVGILVAAGAIVFIYNLSQPSDFDCSIQRVEVATGDRAEWDLDDACK